MIKLKDVSSKVRQITIKNIGRNEPTLARLAAVRFGY
jgi:hypothetical protein